MKLYFPTFLCIGSDVADSYARKGWIRNWTVGQVGALWVVRANFNNLVLLDRVQYLTPPVVSHSFLLLLPVLGVKCHKLHVQSGEKNVS